MDKSETKLEAKLMKVTEVARALAVSEACVRRWILLRKIGYTKISRAVRIPSSEVARIVSEGSVPRREAS